MNIKKFFSIFFWGAIGSCLLYIVFAVIFEKVTLRKYQKVFDQAQHPQGTNLLEALRFRFSYYPATYIDESIGFEPAYVIGELREYTGTWADVESFYQGHNQLPGGKRLIVIPVEIRQGKQQTWLNEAEGFSISPFDAQLLVEIQNRHGTYGLQKNMYLVYASWTKDKDPRR